MIEFSNYDATTEVSKAKDKYKGDSGGVAVGTGATVGTVGLIGGGVPGARPDSGRLNQALGGKGTRTEATRHLVSATRGGVFGYRQDAHQRFMNNQNARLKDWQPHSRINAFERGREAGKVTPEKVIIRHMKNARTASNVALGGGAALVAGGLYARNRSKKRQKQPVIKAARKDNSKFQSDAMIAAGGSTAVGSGVGSLALDAQGRKWAKGAGNDIAAAQKMNRNLGGYDVIQPPKRGSLRSLRHKKGRVPDVKAHRSTGDLMWNGKQAFAGRSNKATEAAGALRGQATQKRYFASVYGKMGSQVRRYGIGGGLALAGAGLAHKHYKMERRPEVSKAAMPTKGLKYASLGFNNKGVHHARSPWQLERIAKNPAKAGHEAARMSKYQGTKNPLEWPSEPFNRSYKTLSRKLATKP